MSSLDIIKHFKEQCEHFYTKFTFSFTPSMSISEFNSFRLNAINILLNVIYTIIFFFRSLKKSSYPPP